MSHSALVAAFVAVCLPAALAQETAQIREENGIARISTNTYRPVQAVAAKLAERFRLPLCVEDPIFLYDGDFQDASLENPRMKKGTSVPHKRALHLEVSSTATPQAMANALLQAANAQLPVRYRLDAEPDRFVLVPVRVRNAAGKMADVTPLLDRKVSIPQDTREIALSAKLMADSLSAQTGMIVSCCQPFVAGIPWGLQKAPFGAANLPAREVFKQLIRLSGGPALWNTGCDRKFCFINIQTLPLNQPN